MPDKMIHKEDCLNLAKDYAVMIAGSLIAAASFSFFFIPFGIAPGGVTGLAEVLASFLPLGTGLISFLINLPLFLFSWKNMGFRFAMRSFVAMTTMSFAIDLFPQTGMTDDLMLASVFGGIIEGIGLGLVVRAGATTGGTDMAAKLLHQSLPFFSIGSLVMFLDAGVVVIAALNFGLKAGLWALIVVFIASKVIDMIIKGFNTAMQFMIITSRPDKIISRIHTELERGCTRLEGTGTYTGQTLCTLICVVSKIETAQLRKIIAEEDAGAFVTVSDVQHALGEGFSGIEKYD